MTYSPSPWEVRTDARDPNAHDVYSAKGGKIAHMPWCHESDARLIAAAPELLSSLRTATAFIEDTFRMALGTMSGAQKAKEVSEHRLLNEFKAAIAKAEGRAE